CRDAGRCAGRDARRDRRGDGPGLRRCAERRRPLAKPLERVARLPRRRRRVHREAPGDLHGSLKRGMPRGRAPGYDTQREQILAPADRERVHDGQRAVVAAFAEAIADTRPELRTRELHKPLTMLLFGMMNWMFTWLKPGGKLTHAAMAPIVADLFFGGLSAV